MLSVHPKPLPTPLAAANHLLGSDAKAMTDQTMDKEKDKIVTDKKELISRSGQIFTSLASGAIAGAVAKSAIAPLDRSKIFFQTNEVKGYRFRYALRWLRHGYKQDGFISLWRGNSATMARIIPYAAIQFMSHEQYKQFLGVDVPGSPSYLRFMAGSMAGVTGQAVTYPLDRARAVMAVTSSQRSQYKSLYHVGSNIVRSEGIPALYRGFTPAMLGVIPYAGTSFFTYETLKLTFKTADNSQLHPLQRLCFGALAGLLGQTASYPLDIVRRRIQTATVLGSSHKYTSILGTLLYVYRNEGIWRGLYKGLSMNFIKGPVATGISFCMFDTVNQSLRWFLLETGIL